MKRRASGPSPLEGAAERFSSLWSADPLSWLATRWLALGCAVSSLVQALVMLSLLGGTVDRPIVQIAALALSLSAFTLVHVATRPHRGSVPESIAWSAIAISLGSVGLSAAGYLEVDFRVQFWWAPVSFSLLLVSLSPFSTVAQLARFGAAGFIVCGALAVGLASGGLLRWPFAVTLYLVELQIVIATVGCVVFVAVVTRLLRAWNERPLLAPHSSPDASRPDDAPLRRHDQAHSSDVAARVDAAMSARLAAPLGLLRGILDRGVVEPEDQRRALELAATLRADLVAQADATWLDRLVEGHPVQVVDPERLADRLSLPQRSALRAMLDALLAHPASGFVEGRIELLPADRGTVAVGLRIVTTLPEGRRETFLAPYYVTLQTVVHGIRWRNGAALEVDFEVPISEASSRPVVQRSPAPSPHRPTR